MIKDETRTKTKTTKNVKVVDSEKVNKFETKSDTKKMSLNKNEKVGIKNNNYAYVLNIPKKVCQNYGSSNHLTHLC